MEFNRNQYFMVGLVLLFVGIQFKMVDSFTFNEKATKFLAERMPQQTASAGGAAARALYPAAAPFSGGKTINPPEWLGWSLISVGSVLVLHSLAMKRPGA